MDFVMLNEEDRTNAWRVLIDWYFVNKQNGQNRTLGFGQNTKLPTVFYTF